ncbi:MAG: DUF6492 family protein [Devosia sp.]
MGTTLVTVIYARELHLLRLQAVSISKYLGPSVEVHSIIIIANGPNQAALRRTILRKVVPLYGRFTTRVIVMLGEELLAESLTGSGWHTQQVIKLEVARKISTPSYLVLDAKNHLVRPLDYVDLFAPDGRIYASILGRTSMEEYLKFSLVATGAVYDDDASTAFSCTTPSLLDTSIVMSLLAYLETNDVLPLSLIMRYPQQEATEFFLYFGHALATNTFDARHTRRMKIDRTIWGDSEAEDNVSLDQVSMDPTIKVMGLHRRGLLARDEGGLSQIATVLRDRALFSSTHRAIRFLKRARAEVDGKRRPLLDLLPDL